MKRVVVVVERSLLFSFAGEFPLHARRREGAPQVIFVKNPLKILTNKTRLNDASCVRLRLTPHFFFLDPFDDDHDNNNNNNNSPTKYMLKKENRLPAIDRQTQS
jgi:hypothetical protein